MHGWDGGPGGGYGAVEAEHTMLKIESVREARPFTGPWHVMPKNPAEVPIVGACARPQAKCNDSSYNDFWLD